ncbi:MAG: acyl-CoA thioesterase domain-containing protein [Thermoleophilaceae bacterium]
MADAFFVCDGERYAASELTRGPWDPNAQHAGPPTALLGRAVERAGSISEAQVARITFEILRPIPIATLTATAEVVRVGRTVELIEGRPLGRAGRARPGTRVARALRRGRPLGRGPAR